MVSVAFVNSSADFLDRTLVDLNASHLSSALKTQLVMAWTDLMEILLSTSLG